MTFTLPHMITESADKYPDKDAFRCGTNKISYSELADKSGQLAYALRDAGLQREDRVGVYLERSLETAIAIYGVMCAGGVYVPLDPLAPSDRTIAQVTDCQIQIIISSPAQKTGLKTLIEKVKLTLLIGLSVDWPVPSLTWKDLETLPKNPKINILEHDLAYIMYTSGSTGSPKGIMHTHHSGLAYVKLSTKLYELSNQDVVATHAPLHFDISTFGYLSSPYTGATSVVIPEAYTKMPASLAQLISREKISIWYSVPLALIQLLQHGVLPDWDFSSLRWVLFGGEVFPAHYLRSLMREWNTAQFSNVYGPAEVNQCTYFHLNELPVGDSDVPIGRVWDNTEVLIIDSQDSQVPSGTSGELLVRSATMMQGYWNQPELTEKSFYRHSSTSGIEKVYYRTGDQVRRSDSGDLIFLGRIDRQVKVRGYRIELDEISRLLKNNQKIEGAAVYLTADDQGEKIIAATIITKDNILLDESEILQYLAKYLPRYAIPTLILFKRSIPRNSNGKIDYQKLQQLNIND
ncbi:MAG: amino acid adenylation domain-containing protein [Saprospiraceae bacterium]|nr:amino acid adenylation domain-containing protein [Saprospiraceae bacterium]